MTDKELIPELLKKVEDLTKEVGYLRKRLSKYENPKNSRNSSMPPSSDVNRPKKNQSLRRSSGKKPGGQPGHKGNTLKMAATPDLVVELSSEYCKNCGASLETMPIVKKQSRQTIDIAPIKVICTEYRSLIKECPCGCRSETDFPSGVNASVSYGENIESLVGYFHARQYLPFARMKEVFNDVFHIDISESGVHCLLNRFAEKTSPLYQMIKQRIQNSKVVGSDETGVKVNGNKHWFWAWQTPKLTYIAHSDNRASATIEGHFPQGFSQSTLVHDGWRPQLNTKAKNHQSCLPHLLRHLNYLNGKYKNVAWGIDFQNLLYKALQIKNKYGEKDKVFTVKRVEVVQQLEHLLSKPPNKKHKELHTFYKRMCRERQHLFTFQIGRAHV